MMMMTMTMMMVMVIVMVMNKGGAYDKTIQIPRSVPRILAWERHI